jgi:hypothetical protein
MSRAVSALSLPPRLRQRCSTCNNEADRRCDYKKGDGEICGIFSCASHGKEIDGKDYCAAHARVIANAVKIEVLCISVDSRGVSLCGAARGPATMSIGTAIGLHDARIAGREPATVSLKACPDCVSAACVKLKAAR